MLLSLHFERVSGLPSAGCFMVCPLSCLPLLPGLAGLDEVQLDLDSNMLQVQINGVSRLCRVDSLSKESGVELILWVNCILWLE